MPKSPAWNDQRKSGKNCSWEDVGAMRLWVAIYLLVFSVSALAQRGQSSSSSQTATSVEEVARKSQNPFADKISLNLNSTLSFNSEPLAGTGYEFDLHSVLPTRLGDNWRILHRPLLSVLHEAGGAPGEDEDEELSAYNAYLARLNAEVKHHGRWHGLR